jgi:hypothetical protein
MVEEGACLSNQGNIRVANAKDGTMHMALALRQPLTTLEPVEETNSR